MVPVPPQISDAFLALDRAGLITFVSPEAAALLGNPVEMLRGQTLDAGRPALSALAAACRTALAAATRGEVPVSLPASSTTWRATLIPSAQGVSLYLHSAEPSSVATIPSAGEERYRAFLALSTEGIWRVELPVPIPVTLPVDEQIDHFYAHAYLAECNDAMARMYGYEHAGDLAGTRLADLLPRAEPRNIAYLREFIAAGYQLRDSESVEYDAQGRRRIFSNTLTGVVEAGLVQRAWGTQQDITARRQAEAAQAASEERYRVLATYATDVISQHAADGTFLYVSPACEKLLGYRADDLVGTSPYGLVHPDDVAAFTEAHRRITASSAAETITYRLRHQDGRYIWMETVSRAFDDRSGDGAIQILSVTRDITVRQTVAEKLRDSEARYRALSEAIPQIIFTTDPAGATEYVNQQWLDYSGLTRAESLAHGWSQALHPDDQPALAAAWREAAASNTVCEAECRLRRSDGSYRWFLMRTLPLLDSAGRVIRWYGAATDITERKEMEDELRRREQAYKTLVQNAPDIIARFDRSFRHVYVSPAVESVTGIPSNLFIGRTNRELGMPETLNKRWERSIARVFETGRPVSLEFVVDVPDGTRSYEARIVPELTTHSQVETVLGITRDVTDHKRAEEERAALLASEQQARENAETAVHVRDQFLSMAAHELKNPLTTLLGNIELLQRRMRNDAAVSERHRQMADTIRDQLIRFNRSINTILDISQLQDGGFTLERAPLDLGELAQRFGATIAPTLDRHQLVVHTASEPLLVDGDELRLEQVLQNLVSNAVKYSPQGGAVEVGVRRTGCMVYLAVTDHGIGIPEDAIPHLFERFFRATNAEPHRISGIGIGLFVVKQIITLHGGTVSARSGAGGTTFEIGLPALCDRAAGQWQSTAIDQPLQA